jgi:hypothetical protein
MAPMKATLHGHEISLRGAIGPTVLLRDLRGHVVASAPVASARARLAAPGSGLWFVEAGKVRTPVIVP